MSALTEKLHALFSKFTSEGQVVEHEVEEAVQAVVEHLSPVADAMKADILAAIDNVAAQLKADVEALRVQLKGDVDEVATAPVASEPAPAEQAETPTAPTA